MKNFFIFLILIFCFQIIYSNPLKDYFPDQVIPDRLQKLPLTDYAVSISEKLERHFYSKYDKPSDKHAVTTIWNAAGPVIDQMGLYYDNIEIHLLETDKLVLVSTPAGKIFISRGVLNLTKNEDELCFLFARELYFIKEQLTPEIRQNVMIRQNLRENKPVISQYFLLIDDLNIIKADRKASYSVFKTGHSPHNCVSFLERLVNIPPDNIDHFQIGDIGKRIDSLKNYIKKAMPYSHIRNENQSLHQNAYYFFILGNKFLKANLTDDAIKAYKRSISIEPTIAETHNNLGIAYSRKGFYHQSDYHYGYAIKFGEDSRYYFNSAVTSIKLGNYTRALDQLKNAISMSPSDRKAHKLYLTIERLVEEMGDYE